MTIDLVYHGPVADPSGYSNSVREYVTALYKLGVNIQVEPVRYWSPIRGCLTPEQEKFFTDLEKVIVRHDAPRIQHTVPDMYKKDKNFYARKMNIGYTVFETSSLPKKWIPKMEMMTKIWCPCDFNLETFVAGGMSKDKLVKIPHIVDTEKMNPENYEPILNIPKKEFYFLTVMDFTARKGWDTLLRAYLREFKGNRDVGLIFKAYFGGVTEQHKKYVAEKIRNFKNSLNIHNAPDIIFFGDVLTEPNLYRLYKTAHAFVYPTKGEGHGLCISEAMAMELPVIVTNWSGQLEFCKSDNSYLIDILGLQDTDEEMMRITPNYQGQKWAIPSEEHLRRLMREVYEHYGDAKIKAKRGRQYLIDNFNWKLIGQKIINEIK